MPTCCVPGCININGGHRFPRNIKLAEQWVRAIRKYLGPDFGSSWIPSSKYTTICRAHFTTDQFVLESYRFGFKYVRARLIKDAVPTVFEPTHVQINRNRDNFPITRRCIVPYCTSGMETCVRKVAFFCVPQNETLRKAWTVAIGCGKLSKYDVVCQKHFNKSDFITERAIEDGTKTKWKNPILSPTAVPSVFSDCYGTLSCAIMKEHPSERVPNTPIDKDLDMSIASTSQQCRTNRLFQSDSQWKCCVPTCRLYKRAPSVFRFPWKDRSTVIKWANILGVNFPISKEMIICSHHFRKEDFLNTKSTGRKKIRRLRKGAIPMLNDPIRVLHDHNYVFDFFRESESICAKIPSRRKKATKLKYSFQVTANSKESAKAPNATIKDRYANHRHKNLAIYNKKTADNRIFVSHWAPDAFSEEKKNYENTVNSSKNKLLKSLLADKELRYPSTTNLYSEPNKDDSTNKLDCRQSIIGVHDILDTVIIKEELQDETADNDYYTSWIINHEPLDIIRENSTTLVKTEPIDDYETDYIIGI